MSRRVLAGIITVTLACAFSVIAKADVMKELVPTGKLRVAIAVAPAPSALYAVKDAASGKFRGVTVDLGTALAKKLGVPVEFLAHLASGEIQNSAGSGKWDVTFMPVDDERKKFVDFGNAYHLLQSTYLVAPGSKLAKMEDADAAGVRIGGVANTATFRAAQRTAPRAVFVTVPGVDAAIAAMNAGEIDCIALSREFSLRAGDENTRLAHPRRRFFEFVHRGGGAEGQARGASLCQPVRRGGQGRGAGAQGLRRHEPEEFPGRAGRDETVISRRRHHPPCALAVMSRSYPMADASVLQQLAPTGKLRVAIAIAPTPSAQFAIKDEATGAYRGVAVILGQALAKKLGVQTELIAHNGSGEIQNSAADNKWDVAFLPVDEERKKFVDFGNAYHLLQSTYLVAPAAKFASVAAANAAGVRIGGVANTATFRTSNKTAPNATHVSFDKADAAVAALRDGQVDALAFSRESLIGLQSKVPGSRILGGGFLNSTTSVAVPKGKPAVLAYVTEFIEEAKAQGLVRKAFDEMGLKSSQVAPAGMKS